MEMQAVKERVVALFKEICKIPHPSRKEERLADFICAFAKEHGCESYRDEINNVLVKVKATAGYEDVPPILLQGHIDMVCEKNADSNHDFSRDPIKYVEKDGFLVAPETTLGADDGVGVSIMLFVIEGGVPAHGAVECLFTVAEEVGLEGAKAFDYSRVSARRMINLDSGGEYKITVGCAGGVRSDVLFAARYTEASGTLLRLSVRGLAGGHSGGCIALGLANAIRLLTEVLCEIYTETPLSLVSINGGDKDNAIPREAEAVITVEDAEIATEIAKRFEARVRPTLRDSDAAFSLSVQAVEDDCSEMMDAGMTRALLSFLATVKCGVMSMCASLPTLVEYSKNLAAVATDGRGVRVTLSSRSALEWQLDESTREIDILASLCHAVTHHSGRYPGWEYAGESNIADLYTAVYERLYGITPERNVVHAGLECGIVKGAVPDMDIISASPIMLGVHAVGESLDLESFGRVAFAVATLLGEK